MTELEKTHSPPGDDEERGARVARSRRDGGGAVGGDVKRTIQGGDIRRTNSGREGSATEGSGAKPVLFMQATTRQFGQVCRVSGQMEEGNSPNSREPS